MLQSSESIAALAAALARAQLELSNPEKSLTATIPGASPREEVRTYRYASLATGLDIVRKSLGRQEIAAVQSTVIDQQTGFVRLMTVLAHSSGEWLSSEWPVCPITETANPQRMGAALTYARRYALFTLVGIAGEDDLDAPESSRPTASSTSKGGTVPASPYPRGEATPVHSNGSRPSTIPRPEPLLSTENSQALQEALLAELALINSTDGLSRWAYRRLRSKNILQDGDARAVENAFQVKIDTAGEPRLAASSELETTAETKDNTPTPKMVVGGPPINPAVAPVTESSHEIETPWRPEPVARVHRAKRRRAEEMQLGIDVAVVGSVTVQESASGHARPVNGGSTERAAPDPGHTPAKALPAVVGRTAVDKSVLHLDEPRRVRDKEHLRYVASQPCLLCSARPSDPHHARFAQPRALGRKVSDEFAVPLCRRHHDELHDSGNEAAWWHAMGIDPIEIARQLWQETCTRRSPSPVRD